MKSFAAFALLAIVGFAQDGETDGAAVPTTTAVTTVTTTEVTNGDYD